MKLTIKKNVFFVILGFLTLLCFIQEGACLHSNYSYDTAQRVSNGSYSVLVDDPGTENDAHYTILTQAGDYIEITVTMSPAAEGYLDLYPSGSVEEMDSASSPKSSYYVSATCGSTGETWFYISLWSYSSTTDYTYYITVSGSTVPDYNAMPGYDLVFLGFSAIAAVGFLAWMILRRRKW